MVKEEEEKDPMQKLQANRFGKRLHFRIKLCRTSEMREYPGFFSFFFIPFLSGLTLRLG